MKVFSLLFALAVLARTALSSAYTNNEYFPYITAKEVAELWDKKVTLSYVKSGGRRLTALKTKSTMSLR